MVIQLPENISSHLRVLWVVIVGGSMKLHCNGQSGM